MIPHSCIVKHDPPNSYGDCLRACIASILNISNTDDVPHFYRDGDDERGQTELREFLASRDRPMRPFYMAMPATTSLADIFTMMTGVNPDIEYLLFCTCDSGDHVVICCNNKVIHDPAWFKAAISGASSNGFWIIAVLVPITP